MPTVDEFNKHVSATRISPTLFQVLEFMVSLGDKEKPPITIKEIATALGTEREAVTYAVHELHNKGYLVGFKKETSETNRSEARRHVVAFHPAISKAQGAFVPQDLENVERIFFGTATVQTAVTEEKVNLQEKFTKETAAFHEANDRTFEERVAKEVEARLCAKLIPLVEELTGKPLSAMLLNAITTAANPSNNLMELQSWAQRIAAVVAEGTKG